MMILDMTTMDSPIPHESALAEATGDEQLQAEVEQPSAAAHDQLSKQDLLNALQSISRYDHPVLLELARKLFTGKTEQIQQLVEAIKDQPDLIDLVRRKVHYDASPPQLDPAVVGVRGESLISTLSKLAGVARRGNMSLAMSKEEADQIEHEVTHCYGVESSTALQERLPPGSQRRYYSPEAAMSMAQAFSTRAEMIETVLMDVVPKLRADWKAQAFQEVKESFQITEEDVRDETTQLPFDTMMEYYVNNLALEFDELFKLPQAQIFDAIFRQDAKRKYPMLRCLIDNLSNLTFAKPLITHLLQSYKTQHGTCVYLSDIIVRNGTATLHTIDDQRPEIRGQEGHIVLTNREIAIELHNVAFGTGLVPPEMFAHIQPNGDTSSKIFSGLFSADANE